MILDFLNIGMKVLDRVLPDKAAREAAQLELLKLQQAGDFKELDAEIQVQIAQIDVNKEEAKNANPFVSGWRPAVGWVCVIGLLYTFLLQPIGSWVSGMYGGPVAPLIDMGNLLILLGGMLGLGGLRSFEKVKGVARD